MNKNTSLTEEFQLKIKAGIYCSLGTLHHQLFPRTQTPHPVKPEQEANSQERPCGYSRAEQPAPGNAEAAIGMPKGRVVWSTKAT
ncbi:hypothetical protein [Bradyrhizobium sp. McL0616]|uniref:hypothetical protein n=1 Tax=Bradyrhizobium sp. McL0616 TaxID=3415674 RepID=UPI003CF7A9BB